MMIPSNVVQILDLYMISVIQKTRERQVMIEDYVALFWLGQINELIVDKTGCVTKSEMKVDAVYCEGRLIDDPIIEREQFEQFISFRSQKILFENICINSRGILILTDQTSNSMMQWQEKNYKYQGSRNELAMLKFAHSFHYLYQSYRPSNQIKKVFPFKSEIRRMITLYQVNDTQLRSYSKGLPHLILPFCSSVLFKGNVLPLNENERNNINKNITSFGADRYLKIVTLAYKDMEFFSEAELNDFVSKAGSDDSNLLNNLTFVALLGISDPIRNESPAVVQSLIDAQINVRLFTGDNLETAISSAKACGILPQNFNREEIDNQVIEGEQLQQFIENSGKFKFRSRRIANPTLDFGVKRDSQVFQFVGIMENNGLAELLCQIKVIAKASAKDKETMLASLKLFDRVVCLTGDDAEQALAIEQAHVGVGLGGGETKTSIRIANVVLLNDSISGIRECVAQGRGVFFAMSQLVQGYLYSSQLLCVFSFLCCLFLQNPYVLSLPNLMLLSMAINYLSIIALVRLNSQIKDKVMLQPSYSRYDAMFGSIQVRQIFWNFFLMLVEALIASFLGYLNDFQMVIGGLIVVIHLEGISASTPSGMIKIQGLVAGYGIILLEFLINGDIVRGVEHDRILYFYLIGVGIIQINQIVAINVRVNRIQSRLIPKYSFVVH